jgi:hypothetical protein
MIGDDKQLTAIDAGGGFRALRLRLGACEDIHHARDRLRDPIHPLCRPAVSLLAGLQKRRSYVLAATLSRTGCQGRSWGAPPS